MKRLGNWFRNHVLYASRNRYLGLCVYVHFLPYVMISYRGSLGWAVRRKVSPGFRGEPSPAAIRRSRFWYRLGY